MNNLVEEVKAFAKQLGADLVGIAGKECFSRLPSIKPDELLPEAQSVIVIGTRRNPYVDQYRPSWNSQEHYVGNLALEMSIVLRTAAFLEDKGYETVSVSYHGIFDPRGVAHKEAIRHLTITSEGEIQGVEEFERIFWERHKFLAHMHLAVEAGLGEIGWCRQVVTPQFGPRVGFVSIITDAELLPDKKIEEPICKKAECGKCVEYCRSGALTPNYGYNLAKCMLQMGVLPPIDSIKRKDQEAIELHFAAMRGAVFPGMGHIGGRGSESGSGRSQAGGCGMCVIACPIGRKRYIAKPKSTTGAVSVSSELL